MVTVFYRGGDYYFFGGGTGGVGFVLPTSTLPLKGPFPVGI